MLQKLCSAWAIVVLLLTPTARPQEVLRKEKRADEAGVHRPGVPAYPFRRYGLWGYVDSGGRVLIAPRFDWAKDFHEGFAAVTSGSQRGYIRADGSWAVILPAGSFPTGRFREGRAWFRDGDLAGCVDSRGVVVIGAKYARYSEYSERLCAVGVKKPVHDPEGRLVQEESYGYLDLDGNVAVPFDLEYAGDFKNGLAPTRSGEGLQWGYINRSGKVVLRDESFNRPADQFIGSISVFNEGSCVVRFSSEGTRHGYSAFFDVAGHRIGRQEFDGASPFSEGLARVHSGHVLGFVDSSLRLTIPARYEEASDFHEGLCRVRQGGRICFIDKTGRIAIAADEKAQPWNDAEDFRGELTRVHVGGKFTETRDGDCWWSGGKWIYINGHGRTVFLCRYDEDHPIQPTLGREHGGRP